MQIKTSNAYQKLKWLSPSEGVWMLCNGYLVNTNILGTNWNNEINQISKQCQILTVRVPKKPYFTEFVDVNKDGKLKGGFSIAIFCLALRELAYKIQPVFVPFINEHNESLGNYDQLVQQIDGKECEAVAGDVTISAYRTQYVDFTIPYMSSEVYILVPTAKKWSQTVLTLIKPFSNSLWLTIVVAFIFIGIAITRLEYSVGNPELKVPMYQQVLMVIWFPISVLFFYEGRILNRCTKFVLVIWLSMIFIVIQIYTASLSSWLIVNQLQPKLPNHYHVVGYEDGSVVRDLATDREIFPTGIDELQPLSNMEEYKTDLDKGIVDAIFDEGPYIDIFLAKYGDSYIKVGPLLEEPGFGFAFSRGSKLQPEFSRAIVKVIESPDYDYMKKKYLGIIYSTQTQPTQTLPQRLDASSFTLLFILVVLATIIAVICSEISIRRKPPQIFPENPMHKTSQTISPDTKEFVEYNE
ncbi:ionotropic glutamate receptor, metazoa [Artemisia annua]|uniref:Ionotropic glutamate receptor, metazoa n=1 Tax=Artemisia annua TaxID=35608 RepID=A0A2U1Q8C0_ARTAN|nr:ionotropic glutamate receptor, metazoa [Artemisia annua]